MEKQIKPASIIPRATIIQLLEAYRKFAVEKLESRADGRADLFRNASYAGLICLAIGAARNEIERVK
jgi:hypothetical protein